MANTDYTVIAVVRGAGPDILSPPADSYFLQGPDYEQSWVTDQNLHIGWDSPQRLRFGQFNDDVLSSQLAQPTGDVITARESQASGKWLFMDGVLRTAAPSQGAWMTDNPGARIGGDAIYPDACDSSRLNCTTHWFYGHVGEIRVYNYALKDSERLSVECQLGQKWGIPVAECINGAPDPTQVTY